MLQTAFFMQTSNRTYDPIFLKGYGRYVQNLVEQIQQEPDRAKRSTYAHDLARLMTLLNTQKNTPLTQEKVWQDIYRMTNYTLDVDSPIPNPKKSPFSGPPPHLAYPSLPEKNRFRYGRHLYEVLRSIKKNNTAAQAEPYLLHIARWIRATSGRHSHPHDIFFHFQSVVGKTYLAPLADLKRKIEEVAPPQQRFVKKPKKRYFKRRRKP